MAELDFEVTDEVDITDKVECSAQHERRRA